MLESLHDGELFASVLQSALVKVIFDNLYGNQIATLAPTQLDNARVAAAQTLQQLDAADGLVAVGVSRTAATALSFEEGLEA